jgi:hypothetical protein
VWRNGSIVPKSMVDRGVSFTNQAEITQATTEWDVGWSSGPVLFRENFLTTAGNRTSDIQSVACRYIDSAISIHN